jgi:hypothetical protein
MCIIDGGLTRGQIMAEFFFDSTTREWATAVAETVPTEAWIAVIGVAAATLAALFATEK